MKKLFFIFILIISFSVTFSQTLENEEQNLQNLFEKLKFAKIDISKDSINKIIVLNFKTFLENENSFEYKFSKLQNVSILQSEDEKLKIFNWNLSYQKGDFKYFGFIQYFDKKGKTYKISELKDNSDKISNPESKSLNPENWFGALYYKILETGSKKNPDYILLAWDGNNNFTNKKIIDVLYFDEENSPVFGKQIFNLENKTVSRIIFEYSEQAKMLLKYDEFYKMIIWDHLSPSRPELKGQFQYYGPDFSYDGLFFEKGIWEFQSNVKVQNEN